MRTSWLVAACAWAGATVAAAAPASAGETLDAIKARASLRVG